MKVIESRNKREGGYYGKFWGRHHRIKSLFHSKLYHLGEGWR